MRSTLIVLLAAASTAFAGPFNLKRQTSSSAGASSSATIDCRTTGCPSAQQCEYVGHGGGGYICVQVPPSSSMSHTSSASTSSASTTPTSKSCVHNADCPSNSFCAYTNGPTGTCASFSDCRGQPQLCKNGYKCSPKDGNPYADPQDPSREFYCAAPTSSSSSASKSASSTSSSASASASATSKVCKHNADCSLDSFCAYTNGPTGLCAKFSDCRGQPQLCKNGYKCSPKDGNPYADPQDSSREYYCAAPTSSSSSASKSSTSSSSSASASASAKVCKHNNDCPLDTFCAYINGPSGFCAKFSDCRGQPQLCKNGYKCTAKDGNPYADPQDSSRTFYCAAPSSSSSSKASSISSAPASSSSASVKPSSSAPASSSAAPASSSGVASSSAAPASSSGAASSAGPASSAAPASSSVKPSKAASSSASAASSSSSSTPDACSQVLKYLKDIKAELNAVQADVAAIKKKLGA